MAPALQVEILDLRHFAASNLRPVLEEESRVWSNRLRWDYRASANLLLQYLDSRVLPGFVAVDAGQVTGYVFCVYEDIKAVIGDVFAVTPRHSSMPAHDVEARLLVHLVELLQSSPGVDRVESQLLLHPHGEHSALFESSGFQLYERLFMELALQRSQPTEEKVSLPSGLVLRPWSDSDFPAAGRLISDAYVGHLDSHINNQYRSVSGSLRFLHNIVRFPGCGVFDPAASRVLAYRDRDELAALLLCSRVCEDVAHVTQICVNRSLRGRGLGKMLLRHCAAHMQHRGFDALTLTVTRENKNAVGLYETLGFESRHTFDAMVWERSSPHRRI
jgi:ribosomal protein S18 acetylase RimI-like enzyme